MNRKSLILAVVGVALLVITGLCALTAFGTFAWFRQNEGFNQAFVSWNTRGTVTEQRTFDIESSAKLSINTESGDIEVKAGDTDQVEVELVKTAWRADEDEAEAAASELTIDVVETQNGLELTFETPPQNGPFMFEAHHLDSIDFIVTVPAEIEVQLETRDGDIDLNGTTGFAALISYFGDVSVQNLTGSLKVDDRNGNITLVGIEGENIGVTTSFGKVEAEDIIGNDVSLNSENGNLTIENVTAKDKFEIESRFGDIDIVDLTAGPVSLTTDNGNVTLEDSQIDGALEITSQFGNFEVIHVDADSYTLSSRNGGITLQGAHGELTLDSDFGDIEITDAYNATLDIFARNGAVEFTGELDPEAEHIIEGEFGDFTITIPSTSSFDIALETEFGDIQTDFQITVSGEINEGKITGELNDGGPLLKVFTRNGNITISELIVEE
ncbi:MAG: DUF4097 family beta strand repeat protein [Anaerolineales bacterium]|nr:DUF4097 family beta strand repeat protein [Anaerolineales bacterium]